MRPRLVKTPDRGSRFHGAVLGYALVGVVAFGAAWLVGGNPGATTTSWGAASVERTRHPGNTDGLTGRTFSHTAGNALKNTAVSGVHRRGLLGEQIGEPGTDVRDDANATGGVPPSRGAPVTGGVKCEPRNVPRADRCRYVSSTASCERLSNLVPYLRLHYCYLGAARAVSVCVQLALVALFFYVLATVAERFFVPALENVAAAMRLPEDVAGATLLSFGNGAPDVFAQIAALSQATSDTSSGVSLAVGAVMGAGMFVSSAVFAVVVIVSPSWAAHHTRRHPGRDDAAESAEAFADVVGGDDADDSYVGRTTSAEPPLDGTPGGHPRHLLDRLRRWVARGGVEVERVPFVRDALFYVVAVAGVFAALLSGDVTLAAAATLGAVYVVYLVALLAPRRITALVAYLSGAQLSGREAAPGAAEGSYETGTRTMGLLEDDEEFDDGYAALIDDGLTGPTGGGLRWGGGGAGSGSHGAPLTAQGVVSRAGDPWTSGGASDGGGLVGPTGGGWSASAFAAAIVRACGKTASVLSTAAEAPVLLALRATMPDLSADPRRQSRLLTSLLPVTAPLFFISVEHLLPSVVSPAGALYGAVCGSMGAVSLFCAWPILTGPDAPMRAVKIMDGVLTAIAFVMSVTWMNATASELVALITAIGKVSGLSETLLGATVLAWGNSVGDMVVNTTVAREGRPAMAIAACFAGPLFNLLMGISVGLAVATGEHGDIAGIKMQNELVILSVCLIVSLLHALIAVPLVHKWHVSRGMACGMLGFYVIFSMMYGLVSGGIIFQSQWI